jgi:hypothetical protein
MQTSYKVLPKSYTNIFKTLVYPYYQRLKNLSCRLSRVWFICVGLRVSPFSHFTFRVFGYDLPTRLFNFMLTDHWRKGKHVNKPYRGLACTSSLNSSQSTSSSNERERFQTWIREVSDDQEKLQRDSLSDSMEWMMMQSVQSSDRSFVSRIVVDTSRNSVGYHLNELIKFCLNLEVMRESVYLLTRKSVA